MKQTNPQGLTESVERFRDLLPKLLVEDPREAGVLLCDLAHGGAAPPDILCETLGLSEDDALAARLVGRALLAEQAQISGVAADWIDILYELDVLDLTTRELHPKEQLIEYRWGELWPQIAEKTQGRPQLGKLELKRQE